MTTASAKQQRYRDRNHRRGRCRLCPHPHPLPGGQCGACTIAHRKRARHWAGKEPREQRCGFCGERTDHTQRTCPERYPLAYRPYPGCCERHPATTIAGEIREAVARALAG